MSPIAIRTATAADLPFLWDMLFESAFTTDEARAAWRRDPPRPPELVKYLDGWGRQGDAGVVAQEAGGTPVGAAWYRIFADGDRGAGVLAPANVPELAIAVEPEHRGRRIGGDLLAALARRAKDDGYGRLVLSVDPRNERALRLYRRAGFTLVDTDDPARGTSLIMQLEL
jgi:ribosomal protein S18 acetylase RimI-like enzyme